MFLAVCDWVELSETLAQPIGMVPDLAGARTVADLTTEDLADVLGIPHETILEWDRGRRPLPAAAAVTICKTFLWPIAMLFRSRTGWYPRTQFAIEHGDLDRPC